MSNGIQTGGSDQATTSSENGELVSLVKSKAMLRTCWEEESNIDIASLHLPISNLTPENCLAIGSIVWDLWIKPWEYGGLNWIEPGIELLVSSTTL